jgi:hypothetical protein
MILGTINAFKSRAGSPRLETDAEVSASLVRQQQPMKRQPVV